MARKTCIVTGANAGIGYETALRLAGAGWETVLACRSFQRGNEALMNMNRELRRFEPGPDGAGRAVFMELDLASFASIRAFVESFKKRYERLDALVCNAGVMACPQQNTVDGYDLQFQVNYLGQVCLFRLLEQFLARSLSPRIIQISSRAHERIRYTHGDFMRYARPLRTGYKAWTAYGMSKLFQVVFTRLAESEYAGRSFRFYAVHPGVARTALLTSPLPAGLRIALAPLAGLAVRAGLLDTPVKASRTPAWLAQAEPALPGGGYWANEKPRDPNPVVNDPVAVEEIWAGTQELLSAADVS
jgi:NAD(P)-dependent dehydrogenase (short-subunit alcohol dehydrogenase family)